MQRWTPDDAGDVSRVGVGAWRRDSVARRGVTRRRTLHIAAALGAGIVVRARLLGPAGIPAARADDGPVGDPAQATATGMLVTISATAEDLELVQPDGRAGGLVLSVTLENRTASDVSGLRLRVPVPAGARITDSGMGELGIAAGTAESGAIAWNDLRVADGARLGPFLYRIEPEQGAEGGVIFREARVQPDVAWVAPAVGQAAAPALPLIGLWGEAGLRRTVLPSLLTIFTRERPDSPTVMIRMAVRAGSRDEDDTTWGGSHWLEHAHFLGTATRPDNQAVFAPTDTIGGSANASTGWEQTDYFRLVPAENFDIALDVLADQLLNSTFPPQAFDRERQVVFQELKTRNDTPTVRASDEFLRLVFQVSPLRRDAGGFVETVATIPIDVILKYRAERYVTGNMAVAAIGNLRHDEAVTTIARAFAALPIGARSPRPRAPEPVQTAPRTLEIGAGTRTAEIRLGWPVPGFDSPEHAALEVIDDLLDLTGRRLEENIRGRGLATVVGSSYFVFSDADTFMLRATTRVDGVQAVIDALLAQIQRLRDGDVTDAEIQAVVRALVGRRLVGQETNAAESFIADQAVADTLESSAEYEARLRRVTVADVQRFAGAYFDTTNYTLVIVRS